MYLLYAAHTVHSPLRSSLDTHRPAARSVRGLRAPSRAGGVGVRGRKLHTCTCPERQPLRSADAPRSGYSTFAEPATTYARRAQPANAQRESRARQARTRCRDREQEAKRRTCASRCRHTAGEAASKLPARVEHPACAAGRGRTFELATASVYGRQTLRGRRARAVVAAFTGAYRNAMKSCLDVEK